MQSDPLQFLKHLVEAASPSGYEDSVATIYSEYVSSFADNVSRDVTGNVIAVLNPHAKMKIMLAGHMDEIGLIIHYIDDKGLLFFSTVGGHDSVVPVGQRVWVHGRERLPGVVGRKAIHLLDATELAKKPEFRELWIDVGASSRSEAEKIVQVGDVATFQYGFQHLMGDLATARAFDNKAGVFIIAETIRLLKQDGGLHEGVGVYAAATVQEEIGSRGAQTAAFAIGAQSGITVDMGHARDVPGTNPQQYGQLDLGKGPGVARGANTNQAVFSVITAAAAEDGIPYQTTVIPGTSPTDAKALQVNRGGMATGLLEVPLRYMHTPCEVLNLADVRNCANLMAAYCRRIRPDTCFTPSLRPSH